MHSLLLALALSPAPAPPSAADALAEYMAALAQAQARWEAIAELAVAGRATEARTLAQEPKPEALGGDYGDKAMRLAEGAFRRAGTPVDPLAAARWAAEFGLPTLAIRLFAQPEPGPGFTADDRVSLLRACVEIGDRPCIARLAPTTQQTKDQEWLDSLATGTLAPWEALRVRAAHLALRPSASLALALWAYRPETATVKSERLKLLASLVGPTGGRLALRTLGTSTDVPGPEAAVALQRLAIEGTGGDADERFASWSALASHPSATDSQRAQAFLQMGLLRRREGRLAEAVELFRKAPWGGGSDATTAALMAGHALFEQGDYASALAAYREAEDKGLGEASRFALYQGMCLEHLGRVREAVAEYAAALLDAPLWWRRPLAWHLVELYDAAGRPDVLATFLDAQGADAYASTLPVRRVMIAYRLEKDRDWPSLVTHLARADPRRDPRDPRREGSIEPVIVRVLARHCEEVAPLLPSVAPNEPRSWIGHVRELCGLGGDGVDVVVRGREAADVQTPELPFPPVARVELPAPIVRAQHKVRRPQLLY